MAAGKYNITIEQGATFDLRLQWLINNVGVQLTTAGWSARMQVRSTHDASTTILSLTSGGGNITMDDQGRIYITASATTTAALDPIEAPSYAVWDLEMVNGSTVKRLLEGYAYITPEVTR